MAEWGETHLEEVDFVGNVRGVVIAIVYATVDGCEAYVSEGVYDGPDGADNVELYDAAP